jgi:DNA ligase D-like protein (predicted ligase)
MLLTLVEAPPEGEEWIHEIKYDGYRTVLALNRDDSRAFTRNGHDWTAKYRPIVDEAAALPCRTAILDAEMVVQGKGGVTDFRALRSAIRSHPERLVLYAFDLLMLDGLDLRRRPLLERRQRLQDLLGNDPDGRIHFSGEMRGKGRAFFQAADKAGLEGTVSKRIDSRYVSGVRSENWLKTKTFAVNDFEVVGVETSRTGIPVALLARGDSYVGNAMISLGRHERAAFWTKVGALEAPKARLAALARNKNAQWVRPGLLVTVRHLRGEEKLRHASVQSLVEK